MYTNANPIPFKLNKAEFTPLDYLFHAICDLSKDYVSMRKGRGPTHEDAYKEGARKTLELLRSGKFNITIKED